MLPWILLLALILRLINLNQSLWLDEAILIQAISRFSLKDLLTQYMPTDFNPPLIYLVNFYWARIFGWSAIALRLPSVIFGLLTVWLLYQLSRILFKKPFALIPALMLSTSGLHIYYSQEVRMYSLAAMAVTGSMWALTSFIKSKRHLIWYIAFSLIILYSHYLVWFILPAQLFLVFILKRSRFKSVFLSQFAALLAVFPWLPTLFKQIKTGLAAAGASSAWSQVVGGADLKNLLLIPVKFLIGRISIDNNLVFAAVLFLPLLLTAFLFYSAFKNWQKQRLASLTLFSWLVLPLVMIILVSFKVPVLSYFRLLFLLPAFYLILTLGITRLSQRWQFLAVAALLAINFVSSSIYLFNPRFHREDWQGLTNILTDKNQSQAPVAIISAVAAPLQYYYAGNIINYSDLSEFDQTFDYSEFWLVPYAEPIFDPSLSTRQQIESLGYQESFKQHFRGNLTLVKYIK